MCSAYEHRGLTLTDDTKTGAVVTMPLLVALATIYGGLHGERLAPIDDDRELPRASDRIRQLG